MITLLEYNKKSLSKLFEFKDTVKFSAISHLIHVCVFPSTSVFIDPGVSSSTPTQPIYGVYYKCFIDYTKTFHKVRQKELVELLGKLDFFEDY